jgi:hypothetical protein
VREAKAQTRRREFEELRFKPGESIEDFSIRLVAIINDLELLGDPQDEYKAVLKFLRIVPRKFRPMVMAIEQTVNLKELTIEDLTGHLITAEEGYELEDVTDGTGKLLLTEEEWASRQKKHAGDTSGKATAKPKQLAGEKGGNGGGTSGGTERRKGNCRYCGKPGHWAKECRKKKRDEERGDVQVHVAQAEVEAPGLLLAMIDGEPESEGTGELVHDSDTTSSRSVAPAVAVVSAVAQTSAGEHCVFLNEERFVPVPTDDER